MPALSIVTPSLNQGAFLEACLDSVRAAAAAIDARVEHFVADGGSTDNTLEILTARSDVRWVSEKDRGQTDAINKGLRQTSGDIVSYLCADDLLEPDSLRLVLEAFANDPEADVVYGDAYFLEEGWKRKKMAGKFSESRLRKGNFLLQPSVFLRRSVIERFGLFDPSLKYCMDHEYWLRICRHTRWHHVPSPLASCRLHAEAKTWSQLPAAWQEARMMQKRYHIRWRPLRDALWMSTLGCHYYRLKRHMIAFAAGRKKKP